MKRTMILSLAAMCLSGQDLPRYPDAVASLQDVLVSKDLSRSTLSAGIDVSTLSLPVVDGSKFTAFEVVVIEGEQIQICSITVNTLNACSRGFAGTAAAAHNSGLAVMGSPTAAHHNRLAAEVLGIQTALGANLSNILRANTDALFKRVTVWDAIPLGNTMLTVRAGEAQVDPTLQQWQTYDGTTTARIDTAGILWGTSIRSTGPGTFSVLNLANNPLTFGTNGYERMRISAEGRVGIGQMAPQFALDVDGVVNATALYVNGSPYVGSQWTTSGSNIYYSLGNALIGKTTDDGSGAKLQVNGTVKATQFTGSGAGLSADTVPIAALAAGDYSSKVTSGAYGISVTGSAGSVPWSGVNGRPTALSSFTNDAGYVTTDLSGKNLSFGTTTRQMLNLFGTGFGVGIQNDHVYFRTGGGFRWIKGGTHEDIFSNTNGSAIMELNAGNGLLYASGFVANGGTGTFYGNISGNAATATAASSVDWSNVSNRPGIDNAGSTLNVLPQNAGAGEGGEIILRDYSGSYGWSIDNSTTGSWFRIFHERPAGGPLSFINVSSASGKAIVFNGLKIGGGAEPNYTLELASDSAAKMSTNYWIVTSDRRVKDNIRPFTDGLDIVRQLHPKVFEYNGKGGTVAGLTGINPIAQEIEPLVPYMVGTVKAPLNPGEEPQDIKTFNPQGLEWMLVNAVKDLDYQTFKPADVTEPEPICNEDTRGHPQYVKDDLEGDVVKVCGRASDGTYTWKMLMQF